MATEYFSDIEELRRRAGLTLAELAERAGYSVGAVQGLEKHNKGAKRLRDAVQKVLNERLLGHVSAAARVAETAGGSADERQVIFERTLSDLTIWRQRAILAASEMRRMAAELIRVATELEEGGAYLSAKSDEPKRHARRRATKYGESK